MGEQEKVAELRSLFLVHSNPEKAIERSKMALNIRTLGPTRKRISTDCC